MWTDADIVAARGPRNSVDPNEPYHVLIEDEPGPDGRLQSVATVFLTNRECPFRCLMCDLWKNTTETRVPVGAIPRQIDFALSQLPPARSIKLYNSGNFFDAQAIPPEDLSAIADRIADFETVIVENHPKLCGDRCLKFRDQIKGELEIALGLETAHAPTLAMLNKQMTRDDFAAACRFLTGNSIHVRTFILLKPPHTTEDEGVARALESLQFAQECGARVCAVIPTRAGNGIMEQLQNAGDFSPPQLSSLEQVAETALAKPVGRVFVDLWDAEQFATCAICAKARIDRLHDMNQQQRVLPPVSCDQCSP